MRTLTLILIVVGVLGVVFAQEDDLTPPETPEEEVPGRTTPMPGTDDESEEPADDNDVGPPPCLGHPPHGKPPHGWRHGPHGPHGPRGPYGGHGPHGKHDHGHHGPPPENDGEEREEEEK